MLNDPENHQNSSKDKIIGKEMLLFHPGGDIKLQQEAILRQEFQGWFEITTSHRYD